MAENLTDEEQGEALKQWFEKNLTSLLFGLGISLAVVFGYQSWQRTTTEEGESASALYQDLVEMVATSSLESLTEEQITSTQFLARSIKEKFEGSTYAVFAALHMAKMAVEKNDLEEAEKELIWALDHAGKSPIAHISRIRLARVVLSKGDAGKVLELLEGIDFGSHLSSYEEVRGDAYLLSGNKFKAREAYQKALLNKIDKTSKPILEMKLSNIERVNSEIQDETLSSDGEQ